MLRYWEVRADFNAGNGMKGGTQSTQVFIQRVFTEHQLLPTLCRVPRTDQWTLQEGRKEGSGGVGREVEGKEAKLLPSASLQFLREPD